MEYTPAEATRALAVSSAGASDFPDRLKATSHTWVKFRMLHRSSALIQCKHADNSRNGPADPSCLREELWSFLKAALHDRLSKARECSHILLVCIISFPVLCTVHML